VAIDPKGKIPSTFVIRLKSRFLSPPGKEDIKMAVWNAVARLSKGDARVPSQVLAPKGLQIVARFRFRGLKGIR